MRTSLYSHRPMNQQVLSRGRLRRLPEPCGVRNIADRTTSRHERRNGTCPPPSAASLSSDVLATLVPDRRRSRPPPPSRTQALIPRSSLFLTRVPLRCCFTAPGARRSPGRARCRPAGSGLAPLSAIRATTLSSCLREPRTGSRVPFAPPGRGAGPWVARRPWLARPDPALDLRRRWAAGQSGRPRLRLLSRAAAVTTMPASRSFFLTEAEVSQPARFHPTATARSTGPEADAGRDPGTAQAPTPGSTAACGRSEAADRGPASVTASSAGDPDASHVWSIRRGDAGQQRPLQRSLTGAGGQRPASLPPPGPSWHPPASFADAPCSRGHPLPGGPGLR